MVGADITHGGSYTGIDYPIKHLIVPFDSAQDLVNKVRWLNSHEDIVEEVARHMAMYSSSCVGSLPSSVALNVALHEIQSMFYYGADSSAVPSTGDTILRSQGWPHAQNKSFDWGSYKSNVDGLPLCQTLPSLVDFN